MSRILIVGANSDLSSAIVSALIEDRHLVQTASPIGDREYESHFLVDTRDENQVARMFSRLPSVAISGLEALIVVADTVGDVARIEWSNSDRWEETYRTNVMGLYYLAKHALPLLREGRRPRIVVLPGDGLLGDAPGYSAYATSRAAVKRLSECLAEEYRADGIIVNSVDKGDIESNVARVRWLLSVTPEGMIDMTSEGRRHHG